MSNTDVSCRRRCKGILSSHFRQLPCVLAVLPHLPFYKRCMGQSSQYQRVGEDEDGADENAVEDARQEVTATFAHWMLRTSMCCFVGLTLYVYLFDSGRKNNTAYRAEFRKNAPAVLFLTVLEMLACGATAHTAARMYTRRRHARAHPAESDKEKARYIEVQLTKAEDGGRPQLYGLGFRPSTDSLEVLVVEGVRRNSLLDCWNKRQVLSTSRNLDDLEGTSSDVNSDQRVMAGAAIVAVNDVSADVGLMQAQLLQPSVTLWVRANVDISTLVENGLFRDDPDWDQGISSQAAVEAHEVQETGESAPDVAAVVIGQQLPAGSTPGLVEPSQVPSGPGCACVTFEDEEPQILMRWAVCSLIFGWVTLIPILLVQPHEERPRQQLFRNYLLKPALIAMPLWIMLWLLDSIQFLIGYQLLHPFWYFSVCHMLLPGALVWCMFKMQIADEQIVLDQRTTRQQEHTSHSDAMYAHEDPSPAFLRELIIANPVAIVCLGGWVAIPIVVCSMLCPLKTSRGRMAQGYVNLMYLPMSFFQLAIGYVLWHIAFDDLPRLYIMTFGMLLSIPCFMVWCFCLFCTSQYGRQDVALCRRQRLERGRNAYSKILGVGESLPSARDVIDCSESTSREWELIFMA